MPIKSFRPITPSLRFATKLVNDDLTTDKPHKPLLAVKQRTGGRNNAGGLTMRHHGGGHKQKLRLIDFKREKYGIPGTVATIEYDPNRSSRIALISYADGEKRYIIQPVGLKVGQSIMSGPEADILVGNALPLKNIPIGNAQAPTLTFLSGYKDTSNTKEAGSIGTFSGSSADGWWCGTSWCGSSVSSDGSSFAYHYDIQPPSGDGLGAYWGFTFLAPNLTKLADNGNTPGVQIDSQSTMKFNAAPNAEWFSTSNNAISVDLKLGHYAVKDGKACNVTLHAEVKPTATAATTYTVGLKDQFKISEACGLTGLDLWNELQDFPISQIQFGAASVNTSVATPGAAKLTYSTKLTLTGPITFQ